MAERHEQDQVFAGPKYALDLREYADHVEVALVRLPGDGDPGIVFEDVWSNRIATSEAARTIFEVMHAQQERWAFWARMTKILGVDFVAALIEAEVHAFVEKANDQIEMERERAAIEVKKAEEARRVWLELRLAKDGPCIVARRGKKKFMVLHVDTAFEARRIWDWVRWQRPSFNDWYALHEKAGSVAVEKLILESMLIEEKRVKASGLSAGGRRPLRYWRPEWRDGDGDHEGDNL